MEHSYSEKEFSISLSNKPLLSLLKKHNFFSSFFPWPGNKLLEGFFELFGIRLPNSAPHSIAEVHQLLMQQVFPQYNDSTLMQDLQIHEQDFADSYTYINLVSLNSTDDFDDDPAENPSGFMYFNGILCYYANGAGEEFGVSPSICRLNIQVLSPDSWKQFSAIDFKKYALPYDIAELIDQNRTSLIMNNERRWLLPAEQFVEFCELVISAAANGQKDAIVYADIMAANGALTYWYFGGEENSSREMPLVGEDNYEIAQRLKYPVDTLTPIDDLKEIVAQFGVSDDDEEAVLRKFGLL